MDLTPAFFDHWREHRALEYMDRVREIFDQAGFDEPWVVRAQLRALEQETRSTLRLSGVDVEEKTVRAILSRAEGTETGDGDVPEVRAYADAHLTALKAAVAEDPVTPALIDDLHARITAGAPSSAEPATDAALAELCDWLAGPPGDLHPVLSTAIAHLELLRMRRWPDGKARLARLASLLLLTRSGYGYRRLYSPSTHWSDPRRLPTRPAQELPPDEAETHPAVEHVVHCLAAALHDTVSWVRAEESAGSLQAMAFGWPLQP